MTTVRAGMLMPSESVSVANTTRSNPAVKHSSTASLKAGIMPAWWGATPASRPAIHCPYPRTRSSSSGRPSVRSAQRSRISSRSSGVVEPDAVV